MSGTPETHFEEIPKFLDLLPRDDDGYPILAKRYRFVEKKPLGRGAMGAVWLAEQIDLGVRRAIKFMTLDRVSSKDSERFRREAQAGARIRHPNLVPVVDFGLAEDGTPWFAMEYMDGCALHKCVSHFSSYEKVLELARVCARALDALHSRGFVHRDLKPSNILVDGLGMPRIIDLGLVKFGDDRTRITTRPIVAGTRRYSAPEQFVDASQATPSADIYALAATLYTVLVGESPPDLFYSRCEDLLRRKRPDLPEAFVALMAKSAEFDPSRRPADAAAFLTELDRIQGASCPPCSEQLAVLDSSDLARHAQSRFCDQSGVDAIIQGDFGISYVLIPPGQFYFGAEPSDAEARPSEWPVQDQLIDAPFWLMQCSLTAGVVRRFLRALPGLGRRFHDLARDPAFARPIKKGILKDDEPADCLSALDACLICEWLTSETGDVHRLPTEVEWEYAARAGETGTRPRPGIHNAFGLLDLFGVNRDWTSSPFDHSPGAPPGVVAAAASLEARATRGAMAYDEPGWHRFSARRPFPASTRKMHLGLRLVREFGAPTSAGDRDGC